MKKKRRFLTLFYSDQRCLSHLRKGIPWYFNVYGIGGADKQIVGESFPYRLKAKGVAYRIVVKPKAGVK